jgi:ATP-dependent DNA helicase HFM1/MER3
MNLPCHLVILKNTVTYTNGEGIKEYSDLEVMQMLGRAGRPQYDTSAVAVIMTRQEKIKKYERMVSGEQILESWCVMDVYVWDHANNIQVSTRISLTILSVLSMELWLSMLTFVFQNAEIGLGAVTNLASAKKWLTSTFLYVRLKANPNHYKLDDGTSESNIDARLENICCRDIDLLRETQLVEGDTKLESTTYGEAMARYCIKFETARMFLSLPKGATISEIVGMALLY